MVLSIAGAGAVEFFVDPVQGDDAGKGTSAETPFRTIERARDAVREAGSGGNATVFLKGGTYPVKETIAFDDRDSGPDGGMVRYVAVGGGRPVLSGGRRISGWTVHDAEKKIYRASAPGLETRQLFVNGVRAVRARSEGGLGNATFDEAGHTTTDTFLAEWKNPTDLEMVYEQIWTKPRCGVAAITVNDGVATLTMDQPGWRWSRNKGMTSAKLPHYYENAIELLDKPGEWYLDRAGAVGHGPSLYYIPRPGEDPATAEMIAPVAERLVTVQGRSIDKPVKNIEFRGLGFSYTTWLRPNGPDGHPDAQNNTIRENGVKAENPNRGADGEIIYDESIIDGAAVTLKYAQNIVFERCRFERLGGTGLNAYAGTSDCTIRGCVFQDVGGTGVQLGDYLGYMDPGSENFCLIGDSDHPGTDRRLLLANNTVTNNYFDRCGADFPSSTAIAAVFPVNSKFTHNFIENMPYTGIHLGWVWTRSPKTAMGGNLIANNYVHNVMRDLNDGGCIYMLGPQSGPDAYTTIRNNHVFRCSNQGIYLDDGSSFYHVADNVIDAIGDKPLKIVHYNKHDVDVVRTYAHKPLGEFKAPRVTVEPAILPVDKVWPPEAVAIKEAAGLEPAYRDIVNAPR